MANALEEKLEDLISLELKKEFQLIRLLVNQNLQKKISFLENFAIPKLMVGETCERCTLENCSDRAAKLDPQLNPNRFDQIR